MKKSLLFLLITLLVSLIAASGGNWTVPEPAPAGEDSDYAESPDQPRLVAETGRDHVDQFSYGLSGLKRPLTAYRISGDAASARKIMCVFAIHGFEDAWYRDGEELVKIAYGVIDYFRVRHDELGSYELLVVPCANPDGVYQGWTNNGPGRCPA